MSTGKRPARIQVVRVQEHLRRIFKTPELLEAFKKFGAQGGKRRAKRLSPEKRKSIAKKAALVRWKKRNPKR